ncbi:unnamed protein product [Closterium sp. NIES-53]
MASRVLVSGLPRSLPPLPPGPAPTCVPCVEGRQRAAPHSSEFPPTEAPLQNFHMDVWGPARVRGQGHERYFLLVVDDYSRYTTVFPLRSKGEVTEVLIDWIRAARLQLRDRFGSDFPVLRLHSDRGGEFSSDLLRAFCHAEGIRQTFTRPASPQQNGIAERRIGMVMDVARTSMIHAAAPHFLWPFAVQYAAHQINLQPRVSLPETSPTLRWTGQVGDASVFRVWGSRASVRDLSADKLSSRDVPCVFLSFPPNAPGWQFYHPTSRCVLSSQDVTFDESVPYYRLFPYRTAPLPPSPLFLAPDAVEPVEVAADSGASRGAEPGCAEAGGATPGRAESGGAGPGGAEPGGAGSGGAESGGTEPERAKPGGVASGGAEPGAAESGGVEPTGTGLGGPSGAFSRRELPSPQELREWFARRRSRAAGAGGTTSAGGSAAAGGSGAGGAAGAGTGGFASARGAGAMGPGGARIGGTGASWPGGAPGAGATGGAGAGGAARVGTTGGSGAGAAVSAGGPAGAGGAAGVRADAGGTGVVPAGSGGAARPRPYFVPLLEQVLDLPPSPSPAPSLECPPPGTTGGLAERREPESRPASPVRPACTSRPVPRSRPPAIPGTHPMALHPSTVSQRVPLPSPPASSLPALVDPESNSLRAARPTVARLLATVVTDPSFESTAASALVTELVDFAAHCSLDFAARLVAASASVCPLSVAGECALSTDVLEDRQEGFQCFSAALPHLVSTLLAPKGDPDAPDIPTPRSYAEAIEGTYIDEVPPPGANIVNGMWIFRVKRPPGSPPVFKARYVARGFSQRQGVDYFQTFSPTPKMTTLRILLHVAAQSDYELHSLDFSTTLLQGTLHEEIWLRRPPGFTGSFPPCTQWSLRWPVYGLRQAPREWHDTLRTTLAALGFTPSTADASLFLRTDTSLPTWSLLRITRDRARRTITLTQSHMVQQVLQRFDFTYSSPQATPLSTRHSLSALPSDESVEPSGPYAELVGCLMYLMTCTRPDLAYPLSILARYVAPGRHRPEHMAAAKRVLRYLCSTSGLGLVLGGRSPVVLTGHADASWVDDLATQRSSQGYTFSLGLGSVSWRSTCSSSVLSSSCEAEIYAGAMAAQELCWLTYLLTDLGEPPRSPPVLYVDNKAMLALCQEHRLEHRTKHIALRYFLAHELQQRGQLRLAYVASEANTADIFTKALQPCDHQRFCTMLACFALLCLTGLVSYLYLTLVQPFFLFLILHIPPHLLAAAPALPRPAESRYYCFCYRPATTATAANAATTATLATAPTAAMASPTVLTFDAEGRAIDFDVWVDDLQLFLQCDSRDGVSPFDHTSGVSTAPTATADSTVRSQWNTRDAVARLAVRSHLPPAERAHFVQYKTAQSLYDAVVARYSSPATAALSRLMLPYLFPDLAAFATVADLVAHLRTSDTRYRAALPTEFCAKNVKLVHHPYFHKEPPPPIYITLYHQVTHLPDSLSSVKDHFLSLCPTELTVDLLEERLAAAEKSILAEVGAVSPPSGRRRNSTGKGSKGGGGGGGGSSGGGGGGGGGGGVGGGGTGSGGVSGGGGGRGGCGGGGGGSGSGGGGGGGGGAGRGAAWYAGRGRSGSAGPCTYVLRTGTRSGEVCGLPHTTQRCFGRLTDAWRTQFLDVVELPRWHDLLLQNVPMFDLDFDAILAAMYALADSPEGDCYLSVPPDPGIAAAALGASAAAPLGASASAAPGAGASATPGAGASTLSGTAHTESLHTFTLDSGASHSFFRDSTTLTPLSRPLAVSLADPSGGPALAHSSTVLPCPAALSGLLSGLHLPSFSTNLVSGADLQEVWVDQFTPGGQRVTHCTCSQTGRHLATFTRRPGSSLYTLTTAPPPVPLSGQIAASSQVFAAASRSSPASAPCSCRLLAHETLLWHHRLGHPSLPRLRGMASCALVFGLPRSPPPLPPGPAPTCVPCVEGRQRAAPHSSSFPPTEAPLQTLHMDVWGPARVRGQGHERYFVLVVDNYSRYTTVSPLRSKNRGGEFSSDLLRAFCRSEGIRQTLTLPASPQQNGIAERHIGMVMDVTHQPSASCLLAGDHTYFAVDGEADKLSSRAIPCVFLGFPPDAPGWQFYHPTLRRILSSQDVTFDESVSYYRTPPVDPLPPEGPAPLGVSLVDPAEPVEVAVDSGAESGGAEPAGAGTGGAECGGAESGRAEPGGAEPGSVEPAGTVSGGAEPARAESGGALGVPPRREPLSPQQLRAAGAGAAGGAAGASGGAAGAGAGAARGAASAGGAAGAGGAVGAGATVGSAGDGAARAAGGAAAAGATGGATGAGAAGAVAAGCAAGAGAAGCAAGAGAAGTGDPWAGGSGSVSAVSGGAARPRPYYVPLLQQPASPLPGPSPYSGPTRGLTERREPESCPVSPASRFVSPVRPVRAGRVSRPRPPPVPSTHYMTLHPSTAPQRVPLPSPPASSLPAGPDPASDSLCESTTAYASYACLPLLYYAISSIG